MFSKSDRVASWTRSRLAFTKITETMMYKDYFSRIGKPLDIRARNQGPKAADEQEETDEDIEEETEEDRVTLIRWEKQWWQKVDARIYV